VGRRPVALTPSLFAVMHERSTGGGTGLIATACKGTHAQALEDIHSATARCCPVLCACLKSQPCLMPGHFYHGRRQSCCSPPRQGCRERFSTLHSCWKCCGKMLVLGRQSRSRAAFTGVGKGASLGCKYKL